MEQQVRVALVAMPWQALDVPSLPLGLLRAVCGRDGRELPKSYFGHLAWAEFLLERSGGEIKPSDYAHIAFTCNFDNVGDWVFSGVLHGDDTFGRTEFDAHRAASGEDVGMALQMRMLAAEFVDRMATAILEDDPDVVGFSTTFQQNVPSLALAARLKRERPDLITVFGGGNCDGVMGAALHRCYPFVDYVVRGEGEEAFPALLHAVEGKQSVDAIPGLCWRSPDGKSVANTETRRTVPPGFIPVPDYDDWHEHMRGSAVRRFIKPKLLAETARGCWWGEAHHCTFCGLNGSFMTFRSKSAEQAVNELLHLVQRYQMLDVVVVDNIIDNAYFDTVLPQLAKLDCDLRIHYEIKANLKPEQVAALRDAGVVYVQPGIESLSSAVLKLMDKGVHAAHNIRTLRDCQSAGLTVVWNWLFGFPGEVPGHYWPAIEQLPALVHLQPPGGVGRVELERFSPYFNKPELGFLRRQVRSTYHYVYDLPERELNDLVYNFDTDHAGIDGEVLEGLNQATARWAEHHEGSTLVRYLDDGGLCVRDRRRGWPQRDHYISDPGLVAAYLEFEHGRSLRGALARLEDQGIRLDEDRLRTWVEELMAAGLLFTESGRYVALATATEPVRMAEAA
ncbi:RiPP maturation radical SAM C-methyltransferase [Streptomyces sp. NPDC060027]|uniref:RiPP maturation radical SAM C-methyltransferase n=1 Tax=Streptomyces sp. NPDC060027 TaxID=3347040 RepID=UPI0036C40CA7